jgi:preprotein translocase subunit SecD
LEALGVSGDVVPQGELSSARIRVSLTDVIDRERVKRLLTTASARLELRAVVSPPLPAPVQTYRTLEEAKAALGTSGEVIAYKNAYGGTETLPRSFIIVEKAPIVSGRDLLNAEAQPMTSSGDYSIALSLNQDAAQRMNDWTGSHLNNFIATVLNGTARSVASVNSQFSSPLEIEGRFSKTEAEDLSLLLRSGDLPASLKIIEEGEIKK